MKNKKNKLNLNRRNFLTLAGNTFLFSHFPSFAWSQISNNKILILIELQGANDGLNTVIPYNQKFYYNLRPNIAIKKEEILTDEDSLEEVEMPKPSIGLTPDAGMDMSKMPDASEMPKPEMPDVKIDVNESKRQFRSIVREVLRKKF